MAVPKQSAPSRSEQNADCAEQFSVARPGNDCSPNGKNNLEVTGRPTEGVCLVGLMVKHLTIFFGLRADWAFASWPSFSFFIWDHSPMVRALGGMMLSEASGGPGWPSLCMRAHHYISRCCQSADAPRHCLWQQGGMAASLLLAPGPQASGGARPESICIATCK